MTLNNYTDIHSHILPGVDDGSRNMEETIHMLQAAYNQGIKRIIATPHYSCGANNISVEELQRIREQVQIEAFRIDKEYQILLGNELYYSEAVIDDLISKKALTLAESRYVLVEFSVKEDYKTIYKSLRELVFAGYAPVLAHVERYISLKKKENLLEELIKLGAYIQMNSSSLIGGLFDTEASYNRKLFKNGLIHLIGSDCHDEKYRIPMMKDVVKTLLLHKAKDILVDQIFL